MACFQHRRVLRAEHHRHAVVHVVFLQRAMLDGDLLRRCIDLRHDAVDQVWRLSVRRGRAKAILIAGVTGALASSVPNLLLIPYFGLAGAESVFLLTELLLVAFRLWLSR